MAGLRNRGKCSSGNREAGPQEALCAGAPRSGRSAFTAQVFTGRSPASVPPVVALHPTVGNEGPSQECVGIIARRPYDPQPKSAPRQLLDPKCTDFQDPGRSIRRWALHSPPGAAESFIQRHVPANAGPANGCSYRLLTGFVLTCADRPGARSTGYCVAWWLERERML
jgi:hypothetical protein